MKYTRRNRRKEVDLSNESIVLDIDGVVANFISHFRRYAVLIGEDLGFDHWTHLRTYQAQENNEAVWQKTSQVLHSSMEAMMLFYSTMPEHDDVNITFPVSAYVTSRQETLQNVTQDWINESSFPDAPVICVGPEEKLPTLRRIEATVFVDDKPENIKALVSSDDIMPFLLKRPWNMQEHLQSIDPQNMAVFPEIIEGKRIEERLRSRVLSKKSSSSFI